jgi:hypothetical protein
MEFAAHFAEVILAIVTTLLAWFTYRLVTATQVLAKDAKASSAAQVGVQTWLELSKRFNSPEMIQARMDLATMCVGLPTQPENYGQIPEPVLSFYEDLGMIHKAGLIDDELAKNAFGYHARRWFIILRPYIDHSRKTDGAGRTLYDKYELYYNHLEKPCTVTLSGKHLTEFLHSEMLLST